MRCHAHDVPLRPWDETTTDPTLVTATDVDGEDAAGLWSSSGRGSTQPETPLPVRGRVLGGRYRLTRALGVGGYGAVFAADDLVARRRVALKVLTPAASQSAEMITRFHREAIAASRARHPHIVEVIDFDVDDDGTQYIVMEYLDGGDLSETLEQDRQLAPARALAIAAQCARGLAAAHRVGVLHRDLKPANVFLVRRPDGGDTVKIIDFGISKLTRAAGDYTDVTSASKVVGTPCYMAPEQARAAPLDARTDVYSLGVMLFEMLVGERPFTGRSALEVLIKHLEAPRVAPSRLRPELGRYPGLDALVLRALAPSAAKRFRSMEELGEAIVACLRGIDPAAAEKATEISGELVAPAVVATGQRRGVAIGVTVVAGAAIVLALAVRSRGAERVVSAARARPVEAATPSTNPVIEPPPPAPVTV
jgi:serine/threonine-protein kinase